MGGLIQTRGTQRLVKFYNGIFDKGSFSGTRKAILNDAVLVALFNTPTKNSTPIRDITQHNKNLFLPQDDQQNHPNLLKRWDYYLVQELLADSQEKMRSFLSAALNLQSGPNGPAGTNGLGDQYAAIHFDCIQADQGQKQTVIQSDEYLLKGNNHDDDTGMLRNTAYSLIVLVTDPIQNAPDKLDNQNIQ